MKLGPWWGTESDKLDMDWTVHRHVLPSLRVHGPTMRLGPRWVTERDELDMDWAVHRPALSPLRDPRAYHEAGPLAGNRTRRAGLGLDRTPPRAALSQGFTGLP